MAQTQLEKSSHCSLPFCADLLIIKSIIWFLNNSNLHAIISALLIINLHGSRGHPTIYFSVLEEIYNNVVPHWSAALISRNHSITCLISFTKKALQIGDYFYLNMEPVCSRIISELASCNCPLEKGIDSSPDYEIVLQE